MLTDPIADMFARIKNAESRRRPAVEIPGSRMKTQIARILKREGFIAGYSIDQEGSKTTLKIRLKYIDDQRPVIQGLQRVSTPGRRVYVKRDAIPRVQNGLGIAILSTPKGLLTDGQSRREKVGGEVVGYVW